MNKIPFKNKLFTKKVMLLSGGSSDMLWQIAEDFMILGGSVALVSRREIELDKRARKLMEISKKKNQS